MLCVTQLEVHLQTQPEFRRRPEKTRQAQFDDADFWADHDTFTPLEAAARLHHRMVQIHPFPNGNGRHARIMADAFLEKRLGRSPIDWAAGQDLQSTNARRIDYIAGLRAADKGDYGPLLAFIGAD